MTNDQKTLLQHVRTYGPCTTAELRRALGHWQAYDSHLRNRLFRLARLGEITYTEDKTPSGIVKRRTWQAA